MSKTAKVQVRRWLGITLLLSGLAGAFIIGFAQSKPDIVVTNPISEEPFTVRKGESVEITAQLSNSTGVAFETAFSVIFMIRQTFPIEEEESRPLGPNEVTCLSYTDPDDKSRCSLTGRDLPTDPNERLNIRFRLERELTANLEVGEYEISAKAGPISDETNKANNTGTAKLIILPVQPNLTILADFALFPSEPRQGDLITISFTIGNDSLADVPLPFRIGFELRAEGENDFIPLGPTSLACLGLQDADCVVPGGITHGEQRRIIAQLATDLLTPGKYTLRITVDADDDVQESKEDDNILTIVFELKDPLRNLTVSNGRLRSRPQTPGGQASFTFTIHNESFAPAEGVELGFSLLQLDNNRVFTDDELRAFSDFACGPNDESFRLNRDQCKVTETEAGLTIAANRSLEVLVQFSTEALDPGGYELSVTVDPNESFEETREDDNTLTIEFNLPEEVPPAQEGPELHPIGITFTPSSPVVQGTQVLVTTVIRNSGNRDAGEFRVEFYLRRENAEEAQSFELFGAQTVAGLRLGMTIEVSSILDTTALEPGLYAIKVTVDPLGQDELDRANNTIIAFLSVLAKPEEQ